jgi:hypothetical protein
VPREICHVGASITASKPRPKLAWPHGWVGGWGGGGGHPKPPTPTRSCKPRSLFYTCGCCLLCWAHVPRPQPFFLPWPSSWRWRSPQNRAQGVLWRSVQTSLSPRPCARPPRAQHAPSGRWQARDTQAGPPFAARRANMVHIGAGAEGMSGYDCIKLWSAHRQHSSPVLNQ